MLAGIELLSSKQHCFKENDLKKSNIKIICVKIIAARKIILELCNFLNIIYILDV